MPRHCFLKYKLVGDTTYDRQQLLWQKQVAITGSINLGSQSSHINEYHTGVARFQNAVSHHWSVRNSILLRCHYSLLHQMLTVSEFFSVANVNSLFIDETNKDNIIQQLFWAVLHGDLFQTVVQKASLQLHNNCNFKPWSWW